MIERDKIQEVLKEYDLSKTKLGMIASHSALDVCDGAAEEGFETIVICQKGREKTYNQYLMAERDGNGNLIRGVVDKAIVYDKFNEIMKTENQKMLVSENALFIPNRSFSSYVTLEEIENEFMIPMVGSRNLLRTEERGEKQDYYWLLEKAGLPFPEKVESPNEINGLSMIKLHHAQKKLERGFFSASSYEEYQKKAELLLKQNVITKDALNNARIERYIIGPVFNFDFFYSPIENKGAKVELLGVDWRFETSLDGHVRLPAPQQMELSETQINDPDQSRIHSVWS
jgi:5-formaminoimidazole-4-carboxamide-1-(beta)-D-ribofuranosyl 5'-monophosphate synthetase